jgi:hypothetical protein
MTDQMRQRLSLICRLQNIVPFIASYVHRSVEVKLLHAEHAGILYLS